MNNLGLIVVYFKAVAHIVTTAFSFLKVRPMTILELHHIAMAYGAQDVLIDVSFKINKGEKVGLSRRKFNGWRR